MSHSHSWSKVDIQQIRTLDSIKAIGWKVTWECSKCGKIKVTRQKFDDNQGNQL